MENPDITQQAHGGAVITWASGSGEARVMSFGADDFLTVDASRAAAPGTPLAGQIVFASGEEHALVVKVRRCRRAEGGRFVIDGRLTSPTRALRAALAGREAP